MLTGTQPAFDMSSIPRHLGLDSAFHDVIPFRPQSFKRSESIQIQGQIRLSAPAAVSTTYPESAYQWLVEVLDGLIDFGKRHGHYGVIKLTKNEYQWLDDILEELICSVGEDENHSLVPLMDFIIRLIANYEQAYVPKLTERFPELAKEVTTETVLENKQLVSNIPKQNDSELAAHAFFSIGYLLGEGNLTKKALAAYDKAIELKPDFVEAYNNRGGVFQKLGKHDQAIVELGKAIGLEPDSAELHYKRGCTKGSFNQFKSAIVDFDKSINLNPNYAEAYCCRGLMKSGLGEYKSAIDDFDKSIELELNPDFIDIYYIKGIVNAESKQYEKAITDFDEAIRLKSDHAEAYDNRGIVKGLLRRYESAISDHTAAIDITPDFAEAYAHRAGAKAELGNIDEARSDIQTALTLAEQQGNVDFKTLVEKWLQRLNLAALKQGSHKKPRRGGQWKGKVKIAEDFDELPESFMEFFRGEDE